MVISLGTLKSLFHFRLFHDLRPKNGKKQVNKFIFAFSIAFSLGVFKKTIFPMH